MYYWRVFENALILQSFTVYREDVIHTKVYKLQSRVWLGLGWESCSIELLSERYFK